MDLQTTTRDISYVTDRQTHTDTHTQTVVSSCVQPDSLVENAAVTQCLVVLLPLVLKLS